MASFETVCKAQIGEQFHNALDFFLFFFHSVTAENNICSSYMNMIINHFK